MKNFIINMPQDSKCYEFPEEIVINQGSSGSISTTMPEQLDSENDKNYWVYGGGSHGGYPGPFVNGGEFKQGVIETEIPMMDNPMMDCKEECDCSVEYSDNDESDSEWNEICKMRDKLRLYVAKKLVEDAIYKDGAKGVKNPGTLLSVLEHL